MPKNKELAKQLSERKANPKKEGARYIDGCFSYGTRSDLGKVWRTHFNVEKDQERCRQTLSFNCDLAEAHKRLDANANGQVTALEVKDLLQSKGFSVNDAELNALVSRYDKDRDGNISLKEFQEEACPKSPVRI